MTQTIRTPVRDTGATALGLASAATYVAGSSPTAFIATEPQRLHDFC